MNKVNIAYLNGISNIGFCQQKGLAKSVASSHEDLRRACLIRKVKPRSYALLPRHVEDSYHSAVVSKLSL